MYRQTNFPSFKLNTQQNWMDERVLTIMKKYEKPHPSATKTSTPQYQQQYSHTPSHWKPSTDYSPITQNHSNLDSDGYRGYRRREQQQQQDYSNYKQRANYGQSQQSVILKQKRERRMQSQNEYQYFDQNQNFHYKRSIERGNLNQISINNIKREKKDLSCNKSGYNQEIYPKYAYQEKRKDAYDAYEPKIESKYNRSPFNCKNQTPSYYKPTDESWTDKSCILNSKKSYIPKRQSSKVYTQAQQSYKNAGNINYIRYEKENKDDIQYDKRISNIQRINNKIKQILTNDDNLQVVEPVSTKSALKNYTPNKNVFPKEEAYSKPKKEQKRLEKGQNQRSKSCIADKKRPERTKVSDEANDEKFKKIQDQIDSFNKRVANLAEEKKKLNIQLPSSISLQPKDLHHLQAKAKMGNISAKKVAKPQAESKLSDKSQKKSFAKKSLDNLVTVQSVHSLSQQQMKNNYKQVDQRDESMMKKRNDVSQNGTYSKIHSNSEDFSESQFYESNNQVEHCSEQTSRASLQTKLLLKNLSEQVKLDEQFRLTKNWFVYSDIHNEYEVLQSILGQRWRQMSLEQIQTEFSVNFQEDDPFYSYRSDHFVLEDMVNNYIICSKHWKEKIEGRWDNIKYIKEGFIQKLDLQNKGFIAIEDLVRILNMQEGTFYRNRDLYMIHQRFLSYEEAGNENLSIEVFNSILSKN